MCEFMCVDGHACLRKGCRGQRSASRISSCLSLPLGQGLFFLSGYMVGELARELRIFLLPPISLKECWEYRRLYADPGDEWFPHWAVSPSPEIYFLMVDFTAKDRLSATLEMWTTMQHRVSTLTGRHELGLSSVAWRGAWSCSADHFLPSLLDSFMLPVWLEGIGDCVSCLQCYFPSYQQAPLETTHVLPFWVGVAGQWKAGHERRATEGRPRQVFRKYLFAIYCSGNIACWIYPSCLLYIYNRITDILEKKKYVLK